MNFQDAVKTCFTKYADFSGCASRPEFWWFVLFGFLGSLVTSLLSTILSGLFSLAILVPSIAAGTRRLHDTDRSGWWQLVALVPFVGWIVVLILFAQPGKANRYASAG